MAKTQHNELNERCPIRDVLDRLGDRWTVLIMTELESGTLRFSELRKKIPDISPRMLAQTLRQLEQDGLVSRTVYPTIPPKVEYTMTALGMSFYDNVKRMVEWAESNHAAVKAARDAYTPQVSYQAK